MVAWIWLRSFFSLRFVTPQAKCETRSLFVRAAVAAMLVACVATPAAAAADARLYFFSATNCPHCAEVRPHLEQLAERHPELEIVEHDIWADREAFKLLRDLLDTHGDQPVTTPTLFLGRQLWIGLNEETVPEIEAAVSRCLAEGCPDAMARLDATGASDEGSPESEQADDMSLPLLGTVDAREVSLPLVTLVLGLLDSFNPCAFFVLLFLLSLMVHAHSHARMLAVGVVFVTFSGLIYFLFMAAWLNLFLVTGAVRYVTVIAGLVAMVAGLINLKDFAISQRGVSLSLSERSKSRLYQKTRHLIQAGSYPSLLGGTAVLAIAANSYELLCTAGFPMIYTRILTLRQLDNWSYYGYLAFYNLVYIVPLMAIVIIFSMTLGAHKLTEREGRSLKLISGMMMISLGGVLIFAPGLLNNLAGTAALLLGALALSGVILVIGYWREKADSE